MASGKTRDPRPLGVVVVGASGDLALRKIYPALFALYCQGLLPEVFRVVGYARSKLTNEAFRERVMAHLTCRYTPGERCDEYMKAFLERCVYVPGQYNDPDDYAYIESQLAPLGEANRLFYMSIPPFLFLDVARTLHSAGLVQETPGGPWVRVVLEKPFGHDRASSDDLTATMGEVIPEDQTYRIDHYLGKEVIQNLMVLRFANLIFDPIWNRAHIRSVEITWSENLSLSGRAGYFDQYGIIRDVMQNHLLQVLALVAMEQPLSLHARDVRDEKVKALGAIPPITMEDIVVGQYTAGELKGKQYAGYLEEEGTPEGSITPTFAAAVLHVRNRRWDGVPFLIRAGKGLSEGLTEIRVRFHDVPGPIFEGLSSNMLVIRVQPDAGIALRLVHKVPGLGVSLDARNLNLQYDSAFEGVIPDAYESLLLDVIEGDKSLFIRADELEAAWDIFTPALHALEEQHVVPDPYPFGGNGPEGADALARRYGFQDEG